MVQYLIKQNVPAAIQFRKHYGNACDYPGAFLVLQTLNYRLLELFGNYVIQTALSVTKVSPNSNIVIHKYLVKTQPDCGS